MARPGDDHRSNPRTLVGVDLLRRRVSSARRRCRNCCRDAAPFERWGPSYADGVEQVPTIEDSRGVDISQIRRQLRMTVPERVRSMVEAANTMLAIQERAQASLRREL